MLMWDLICVVLVELAIVLCLVGIGAGLIIFYLFKNIREFDRWFKGEDEQ